MRMKYCTNCGNKINVVNPKFCPECGYSFSSTGRIEKEEDKNEATVIDKEALPKPEVTIEMGTSKPITFGNVIKQGEEASKEEITASKRPPHEYSGMSKDEIKKALMKECGPSRRDKEISEE